jgi:hypothetical protein
LDEPIVSQARREAKILLRTAGIREVVEICLPINEGKLLANMA